MANEIDNRVVSLQFDNSRFEDNTKKSLNTIEKLKNALKFDGAKKSFSDVEKESSKLNFKPVSSAADTVIKKFSALEIAGVTAIANITNSVVNLGKRMVKSLTVDQLSSGWNKYEKKTTAVATLVSATRTQYEDAEKQMEDINAQLEKMLWFTDETSYDFTDMIDNMGKFISNGIALDKAATAMEGIATWAAASGQNASAASRVMYNLSQAIGLGAVTLVDWKSVELANMATVEFKQNVIDVATELGKLPKGIDVTTENFRESLEKKWFDGEVLTEVLSRYGSFSDRLNEITDDLDLTATETLRYMEQFEKGTLNMDEAMHRTGKTEEELISIMTELNSKENEVGRNAFKMAQEARTFSDAMAAIKDGVSTAWMRVSETIFGSYNDAKKMWTNLANLGYEAFAEPVNRINDWLTDFKAEHGFDKMSASLINLKAIASQAISPLKELFTGVFGENAFKIDPKNVVQSLAKINTKLLRLRVSQKQWLDTFKESRGVTYLIGFFDSLKRTASAIFSPIKSAFQSVFGAKPMKAIKDRIASALKIDPKNLANSIQSITSRINTFAFKVEYSFDKLKEKSELFFNVFKDGGKVASKALSKVKDTIGKIKDNLSSIGSVKDVFSILKEKAATAFQKIKDAISKVASFIKNLLPNLFSGKSGLEVGSDILGMGLIAGLTTAFLNIGKFFKGLKTGDLGILQSIKDFFSSLTDAIGKGADFSDKLRNIAVSIAILAGSLILLSAVDPNGLKSAIGALLLVMTSLVAIIHSLSGLSSGDGISSFGDFIKRFLDQRQLSKIGSNLIKFAASVMILSIGLAILVPVIRKLGELDVATLAKGLGAVITLLAAFGGFSVMAGKLGGNFIKAGVGMLLVSVAMSIFASVIQRIGAVDVSSIGKALGAIVVLMAAFGGLSVMAGRLGGSFIKTGVSMVLVAASMIIFASVIEKIGSIDVASIGKALGAIIVLMAAFGGLTIMTGKLGGKIMATAVGLLLVSSAIAIVAASIGLLSILDTGSMIKATAAIVALLAVISIMGLVLGGMSTKFLTISAGMLMISVSIFVLVGALAALSVIPYDRLSSNLILFAGAMLGILAAGAIANLIVPGLLALSAALIAFGIAALSIGAGIALLSAGFAILATAGPAGVAVMSMALLSIIELIPQFSAAIAEGIITFATVIMNGASILGQAAVTCIVEIIKAIANGAGDILDAVIDLVVAILTGIAKLIPSLINAGKELIRSIFKGAKEESSSAEGEAEELGSGIGNGLKNGVESGAADAKGILSGAVSSITDGLPTADMSSIGEGLIGSIGEGMDGFDIQTIMGETIGPQLSSLDLSSYGGDAVGQEFVDTFASGIEANSETAKISFATVVSQAIEAANSKHQDFVDSGRYGGEGLVAGLVSNAANAYAAGLKIAKAAVSGVNAGLDNRSPSHLLEKSGVFGGLGLVKGLESTVTLVRNAGKDIGEEAISGVSSSIAKISDIVSSDTDSEPVIRPVLDLSNVESGARRIGGMFGGEKILASASYSNAGRISDQMEANSKAGIQNGSSFGNSNTVNIYPQQVTSATVDYLYRKFNSKFGG